MYLYKRSRKSLVIMLLIGFLGSTFASALKINTRSAQAYYPPEDLNAQILSRFAQGGMVGSIQDASIQATAFEARITAGANDAEERTSDGFMYLDSSDLELVNDPGVTKGIQTVGMRFTGVNIPTGSTIIQAYIDFEVDEASNEATSLVIYGQADDNPATFTTSPHNITSRTKTAASISWSNIPSWNTVGARVQTPGLAGIVQEIVNRGGWVSGNSLVILVEGSGRRVAAAYEVGAAMAPLLHVDFSPPGGSPTPPPPSTPTPTPASTNPAPTSTPVPPTSTPLPPTSTPLPPTPTSTGFAPTATTVPSTPTSTPVSTDQPFMVDSYVDSRDDDAEERLSDGRMYLTSTDLEFINDPGVSKGNQRIGLRFSGIGIPRGYTISQAYLEFTVDEASSEATSLMIYAQASDNAASFTNASHNVTNRSKTTTSVSWNNIPAWNSVGDKVQSPDLTGVIQEVVNRSGWNEGNSLAFIIEGTGRRVASAFESNLVQARLHVVYLPIISTTTPPPPPPPPNPTQTPPPNPTQTPPPNPTQTPPPNPQPTPVGQTGEWQMKFFDEFASNSLDTSKWRTCFWWADVTCTIESNSEMELYNPEDVLVQDGHLRLRAQHRDMVAWNGVTYHYTSGMVMTGGRSGQIPPSFTFVYGYAEAMVKVPAGQGLWPAFWTLSADYGWPPEIDIMEILGHQTDAYHMNYHYTGGNAGTTWNGPDFSAGWHVLGLEWRADAIIWYVDGVERWRFSDANKIISEPSYLLLNLAVGGNWPGPPDDTTPFPSYFDIDYVRVWQRP